MGTSYTNRGPIDNARGGARFMVPFGHARCAISLVRTQEITKMAPHESMRSTRLATSSVGGARHNLVRPGVRARPARPAKVEAARSERALRAGLRPRGDAIHR